MPPATINLGERFRQGQTFSEFLESAEKLVEFWRAMAERAAVEEDQIRRARALTRRWHLLVLNADWCGDSVSTIPYIARLLGEAPNIEMRLIDRDQNRDLMDVHLTGGARSIPKILLLDQKLEECGSWGPRPAELQQWVKEHGLALSREDRYREIRSWYARDRGRSTIGELLALLEGCELLRRA